MEKNPLNKGILTDNSTGLGAVTRDSVQARARDGARIAGRDPQQVTPADLEQARRELTDGADMDPQEEILEALPESKRWDPVPGSTGHQAPESASEDEDDEGRSETEQLVEQGAGEAERDQILQAAKAAEKTDRSES
jgi:hypothetical protein